ncbi:heme-dependent oxidative N-demethylase family protein [Acidimangrovimonas pyrenivorans]|uniref:DUF3445 domain-containing protein n=1 Tax=Acidimangrovimonas pyrenivorans TaxID=2030798 RepID=A0ABV7AFQ4_9RHOB
MTTILHKHLPFAPWADPRTRRLPGILPLEPGDWLRVDEAFAGQMAERDRLIAGKPEAVHRLAPEALPAARELLALVLAELSALPGYVVGREVVTRPDGMAVKLDRDAPLLTLGRLCQEDFCLLQQQGDEHVLTGAILCFPASWTLEEKYGRPLIGIHDNVPVYDDNIARRVQRLFDAIRPGRGLWRANALLYEDPSLFHPKREADPRKKPASAPFLRSERQCLLRLPESGAVVFSIHTYLLRVEDLSEEQAAALDEHPIEVTV